VRFVIAQRRLATPGGSETFVLTIAEHIARLGHMVVVYALDLGMAAELARSRAIHVVDNIAQLPDEMDATMALDRVMAIDLAHRYPRARRLYVMHNADEPWLPPPASEIVVATVAPNERLATLAHGCVGAGKVLRIRQPIDLRRFSPRGWARAQPSRVLLLGNYYGIPGQRFDQLQEAWASAGIEWHRLGVPEPTTAVAEEIAKADIVVGYGRSIIEAMACGRPAYVHDHSGSDGWVTRQSYARLEADGFAGTGLRRMPSIHQLREDLQRYEPALGRVGQDLARSYHDARTIAAELVAFVERLGCALVQYDSASLLALRNLAESQLRADLLADQYRLEAKQQAEARRLEERLYGEERSALILRCERLETEFAALSELRQSESKSHQEERERLRLVQHEYAALERVLTSERAQADLSLRKARLTYRVTAPIREIWRFARRVRFREKLENIRPDKVERVRNAFNRAYYLAEYPDVREAGVDPFEHYMRTGWREGRDPSPDFSTSYYLKHAPDVATAEINPFVHWVLHGIAEKRLARPSEEKPPHRP
jgi:hypothetical protein